MRLFHYLLEVGSDNIWDAKSLHNAVVRKFITRKRSYGYTISILILYRALRR